MSRRELKDALDTAKKEGWSVEKTNGGHVTCRHPYGAWPVITSSTPSDSRSILNFKSVLKRSLREAGYDDENPNPETALVAAMAEEPVITPQPEAPPEPPPVAPPEPRPCVEVVPPEKMQRMLAERARDDALEELSQERKKVAALEKQLREFEQLRSAIGRVTGTTEIVKPTRAKRIPSAARMAQPLEQLELVPMPPPPARIHQSRWDPKKFCGEYVREGRLRVGLNQSDFATKIGLTQTTVSAVERNARALTQEEQRRIDIVIWPEARPNSTKQHNTQKSSRAVSGHA